MGCVVFFTVYIYVCIYIVYSILYFVYILYSIYDFELLKRFCILSCGLFRFKTDCLISYPIYLLFISVYIISMSMNVL